MSAVRTTISIRAATDADAAAVAAIYNEGIADRLATFETRERDSRDIADWFSDRLPFLVATDERGVVVGFARASAYSDRCVYTGVGEPAIAKAEA